MPPRFESVHLDDHHAFATFQSVEPKIDQWLKRRARKAHREGSAVVYVWVASADPSQVVAFYSLSNLSFERPQGWPGELPQISATLLGRMGRSVTGTVPGDGDQLLRDALQRAKNISRDSGSRYVVVDAKNEALASWYEERDFVRLPGGDLRLALPIVDIPDSVAGPQGERPEVLSHPD
jgi:hypothetical protein